MINRHLPKNDWTGKRSWIKETIVKISGRSVGLLLVLHLLASVCTAADTFSVVEKRDGVSVEIDGYKKVSADNVLISIKLTGKATLQVTYWEIQDIPFGPTIRVFNAEGKECPYTLEGQRTLGIMGPRSSHPHYLAFNQAARENISLDKYFKFSPGTWMVRLTMDFATYSKGQPDHSISNVVDSVVLIEIQK
jgi:hypothetical protein